MKDLTIKPKQFPDSIYSLKGISKKLIEEHLKLYQGYVKKYNEIITALQNLTDDDYASANASYSKLRELKTELTFAWGGVKNHEIYFNHLNPQNSEPKGEILKQINIDFGSMDNFKKDLKATGIAARGWVWVCWNKRMGCLFNYLSDTHNLYSVWGVRPVMVMDVYEHAYFMDYGTARADYIDGFISNIDWIKVNDRFKKVVGDCCRDGDSSCCRAKK